MVFFRTLRSQRNLIGEEDERFLRTLFEDGIMHVSYIHMAKNGKIDQIAGPLAGYRRCISKLEVRHRMAVVEENSSKANVSKSS